MKEIYPIASEQDPRKIKWLDYKSKITDEYNAVYAIARSQKKILWLFRRITEYEKTLKEKYLDTQKYIAIHPIGGSSMVTYEEAPDLDFPEPDSVKTLLKKIKEELGNESK